MTADLSPSYPLSENQRTYVDSVLSHQPAVDRAAIAANLAELTYPIHFLTLRHKTLPFLDLMG